MQKFGSLRDLLEKSFRVHSSLAGVSINKISDGKDPLWQIDATYAQDNIKLGKPEKILKTFVYNGQGLLQTGALGQVDSAVVCNSVSDSG
jgi:hypothetical protein